jgi:hypothetical protein
LKKDAASPSSGETVCVVPPSEATKNVPSSNISSENILKGSADSLVNTNLVNGSLRLNVDEVKLSDKEVSKNDEHCPVSSSDPGRSYTNSNDTTLHEKDPVASDFSPHGATLGRNAVLDSSKATNPKVSNEHTAMHVESSAVQIPEKTIPQDTKVIESSEVDPLEKTIMHVSAVTASIEVHPANAEGAMVVDPSQMPPLGERRIPQGTVLTESCEMQPMKKNTVEGAACAELGETKVGMENIEHCPVVTASSEVQLPETSNVQGPDLAALGGVQSTKECNQLHAIDYYVK